VTDTHTACESFQWIDGNTYFNSNNTATYTLSTTHGCDSIVTLNLTISNPEAVITQNPDGSLMASAGDSYQWINCADNTPLAGAVGQSFLPSQNGSYSVVVFENNCQDTASCVIFEGLGMNELPVGGCTVYPNPSNTGTFTVTFTDMQKNVTLYARSVDGKLLQTFCYDEVQSVPVDLTNAVGYYLLEIYVSGILRSKIPVIVTK
jgi:hypothetical protein